METEGSVYTCKYIKSLNGVYRLPYRWGTSLSRDITGCHIKRSLLGMNYILWAALLGGSIDSQTYRLWNCMCLSSRTTPRSHCKTHTIQWAIESGEINWSIPGRFLHDI